MSESSGIGISIGGVEPSVGGIESSRAILDSDVSVFVFGSCGSMERTIDLSFIEYLVCLHGGNTTI